MENHRPLPRLPLELFEKIVGKTEVATKFNAAFSCRQMLNLLRADLPHINCLSVLFDPDACDGVVLFKDVNNTSAVVCQCEEHVDRQRVFLEEVLGACCGQVTSVTIDDLLANRNPDETVRDNAFNVLLTGINPESLHRLAFCNVDFSSVRIWTLSILAKCSSLHSVTFEACKFPSEFSETFLSRMLAPSFPHMEELKITGTGTISDKLCMTMAKKCHKLQQLSLRGCHRVTAFSVVAFCEALMMAADSIPITVDLRGTSFDSMELSRHLENSLLRCGPCWKAQNIVVNIGFDRKALLIGNVQRTDLFIMVYFD